MNTEILERNKKRVRRQMEEEGEEVDEEKVEEIARDLTALAEIFLTGVETRLGKKRKSG